MKWYVANLIVECRVARRASELWDEQVVVIRAKDASAAYDEAIRLGRDQNHSYKNSDRETVFWRFIGLAQLQELNTGRIQSGTEIYSRLTGDARPHRPAKRNLLVFWTARNLNRTAGELLSEAMRPFAPR